jgi:hypothetical protein
MPVTLTAPTTAICTAPTTASCSAERLTLNDLHVVIQSGSQHSSSG